MAGTKAAATANVTAVPPYTPSQDFLGLMVGARGRLPQNDPNAYAAMSYRKTRAMTISIRARPAFLWASSMNTNPARKGPYRIPSIVAPTLPMRFSRDLSGAAMYHRNDRNRPRATKNTIGDSPRRYAPAMLRPPTASPSAVAG